MIRTLAALCLVLSPSVFASIDARAEYERLQSWQFSAPVPLPAGGVTITRDTATWTLQSGTVRLIQPTADGVVTGFAFEGDGRFRLNIPDRYELAQLRRFSRKRELDAFDQPFTQLVFRTSDPSVAKLLPSPSGDPTAYSVAARRHQSWLVDLRVDADARIVAALLNPGEEQTIAAMETKDFDWVTYEYDALRPEEITLTKLDSQWPEVWISLDRAEDRQTDGRPGARWSAVASLDHIDVKADLTKSGIEVGRHHQKTIEGGYVVEATFRGIAESVSALRLELWSIAKNLRASAEDGTTLTVIRDHVGKRAAMIDNRVYDDDFVLVLASPLKRGETMRIRFEYELESGNFAPGGLWYPNVPEALHQKHTARLELTVRKRNEVRAMGRMEKRTESDKTETSVWIVDKPATMVTFSTATRFEEVKVAPQNIPPVFAFGPDYQASNTAKMRNVAADVANSMQWFQNIFGEQISGEKFFVTSIASSHGQAFDGFLHMGEFTWAAEHPGASELFRAHEVAHEWWGHKVGWNTYRDQWLSEAFAEYSAMLFVQNFVKGGDKYFNEILMSYDGIVKGNMAGGFSKFNRPWLIERSTVERNRLGPIGHGQRASTGDIPAGYVIQTYIKGPLVLHMLRMLMRYKTESDELFLTTLRDFVKLYNGKNPSTADFQKLLEQKTKANWNWFFDAWIYGGDIPSYTWRYDVKPGADGAQMLTMQLDRRDVRDDFMVIIPVRVEFTDGKVGLLYVVNKEPKQTVTQKLPGNVKNVVFAPEYSLLANIRRD